MRRVALDLFAALLTFSIGVACTFTAQHERRVLQMREAVLRDDLYQMRKLIDQYAADKGKLPASLEDLVGAGYMREIPTDPITGEGSWNLIMGEDPYSAEGGQGVTDVRSLSPDTASGGMRYDEW